MVDQNLEHKGILANTAFVLGLTAGRELPDETFGNDVQDGAGDTHKYLTRIGHFVKKAGQSKLRTLREQFSKDPEVLVVDYCDDAAPSDYSEYQKNIALHKGEQIIYRAIHIFGPQSKVVPLTKNLSRLE